MLLSLAAVGLALAALVRTSAGTCVSRPGGPRRSISRPCCSSPSPRSPSSSTCGRSGTVRRAARWAPRRPRSRSAPRPSSVSGLRDDPSRATAAARSDPGPVAGSTGQPTRARSRGTSPPPGSARDLPNARVRSPGGLDPSDLGDGEAARCRAPTRRRARDEGHAVSGHDCALDRLLEAELEMDVEVSEPQAGGSSSPSMHGPNTGAGLHHDQRLLAQLVERQSSGRRSDAPGGQTSTTSSRKKVSNETERCLRAAPTTPSSSSRRATSSTMRCVSWTDSATVSSGCCRWNSQRSRVTTFAPGPVDAPISSRPRAGRPPRR